MLPILDSLFNGLSIGSVLLISALGLAIVFGLMGVINMAHGELMMLGAYTTFVVQNIVKPLGDNVFNFYILIALPCAFLVAGIVGFFLERGVIRYLYGRPLETLLATWGVSLILQQLVRSINGVMTAGVVSFCFLFFGGMTLISRRLDWDQIKSKFLLIALPLSLGISGLIGFLIFQGKNPSWVTPWFSARNVDVTAPAWLRGGLPIGAFQLPYIRIFIIILTLICLAVMYWFLNKSDWGLKVRSVTQNRTMSSCLGIDVNKVDSLTFALGSGLAGIAGCAISFLGSVGPNTGQNYIVDTFMVVVVGGVGNLLGTVIAAMSIGILNYLIGSGTIVQLLLPHTALQPLTDFFTFFATSSMAKVMLFALIITFLQIKPAGIFPPKGRTAEL